MIYSAIIAAVYSCCLPLIRRPILSSLFARLFLRYFTSRAPRTCEHHGAVQRRAQVVQPRLYARHFPIFARRTRRGMSAGTSVAVNIYNIHGLISCNVPINQSNRVRPRVAVSYRHSLLTFSRFSIESLRILDPCQQDVHVTVSEKHGCLRSVVFLLCAFRQNSSFKRVPCRFYRCFVRTHLLRCRERQ